MAEIRISRVLALPTPLAASTIYIVQSAEAGLAEMVFTSNDGSVVRHILNKADVAAMITAAVSGLSGGSGGAATSATRLETARLINGVAFDGTANIVINAVDSTARIAVSEKGAVNGVATLDGTGKVPATQLPSYVDDVEEVATQAALPAVGETGKIYITLDQGKIFRWTGTLYTEINTSVGSADTATRLVQARTIAATGDVTWQVNFDGSANVSAAASLSNTGIAAGVYPVLTVDAKGRATAGRALTAADIPQLDFNKVVSARALELTATEW
jgi:hypothetical protein